MVCYGVSDVYYEDVLLYMGHVLRRKGSASSREERGALPGERGGGGEETKRDTLWGGNGKKYM